MACGWLACCCFIPFLAGNVLSTASNILVAQFAPSISGQIIFAGLAVAALVLSFIPRQILILLMTLGVIASIVLANMMGSTYNLGIGPVLSLRSGVMQLYLHLSRAG